MSRIVTESGILGSLELSLTSSAGQSWWMPRSPAFGVGVLEEDIGTTVIHLLSTALGRDKALVSLGPKPPLHVGMLGEFGLGMGTACPGWRGSLSPQVMSLGCLAHIQGRFLIVPCFQKFIHLILVCDAS